MVSEEDPRFRNEVREVTTTSDGVSPALPRQLSIESLKRRVNWASRWVAGAVVATGKSVLSREI